MSQSSQDKQKETHNHLVYSYMTLRNLIGFSGILLPWVLAITSAINGDKPFEPSISDYYYTGGGDMFVVMMSLTGVFLFTYKGYDFKEMTLTILAAIGSIGVAFFPTSTKPSNNLASIHHSQTEVPNIMGFEFHFLFAIMFFLSLASISMWFFTKTGESTLKNPNGTLTQKGKRNNVYRICAWVMFGSVLILALFFFIEPIHEMIGDFPFIYTMETIAVTAFGISWLTKGETLWPDGEHYVVRGYKEVKGKMEGK